MTSHGIHFSYPPLLADVDSIRVFTVAPDDFFNPLTGTLDVVTFGEKPKYVALSYTWKSAYSDNSELPISARDARSLFRSRIDPPSRLRSKLYTSPGGPTSASTNQLLDEKAEALPQQQDNPSHSGSNDSASITINGQPFHIGHNIHLSLQHLRSPTHPLVVWADAICINQADIEERNRQVSLMSFIYTRATRVVAWLGTKNYPSVGGLFRIMSLEWKAGRTRHLAATIAGGAKMRSSPKPNQRTMVRIAESAYWTRLWIVQEICLPRVLFLVYGSEIWAYEDFSQWAFLPVAEQSLPQPLVDIYGAMRQLLETRENRHTDMMTLESLIERFAKSKCAELRDRVYGLLGCANDIRPFAGQNVRAITAQDDHEHINCGNSGQKTPFESQRGAGSLQVDYSLSFYEIWTSVINFVFYQAKNVEGRIEVQVVSEAQKETLGERVSDLLNEERCVSIVRTAGIVQNALGQMIEEEYVDPWHKTHLPSITAIGYIAGEVVQTGPEYSSLIASFHSKQDWTSCWIDHYHKAHDMENLRRIDENYTAKILDYEQRDVDRIREIRNPHVIAWPIIQGRLGTSDLSHDAEYEANWASKQADKQEPRICLGTDFVIGLVPPAAKLGDVIVRFWNCDAAIVMRPTETSMTKTANLSYALVGRADIAEILDRTATPGYDHHAEKCMSGFTATGSRESSKHPGAVYVALTLRTLQLITASIAT